MKLKSQREEELDPEDLEYDRISVIDIDGVLFFDPPIDSQFKDDPKKLLEELEALLLSKDYKREEMYIPYCDECLSTDIKRFNLCPKCQSTKIVKDVVIRHYCGYRGVKKAFLYIDHLRCPYCKKKLEREGGDYTIEGVKNKCMDCSYIFDEPNVKYRCLRCNRNLGENPPKLRLIEYSKKIM